MRKYNSLFKPAGFGEKPAPGYICKGAGCEAYRCHLHPRFALNWLIHYHGRYSRSHPGRRPKKNMLKKNTGALSFRLSDEDMLRLDKESAIFK